MYIVPVIVDESGSIMTAELTPKEAICTITTPDGCEVYMPGDEEALAARLAAQEVDLCLG